MKKPNKYLIFALSLAIVNLIVIFLIFGIFKNTESRSLIETAHWISGMEYDPIAMCGGAALRPLAPALSLPFEALGEGTGLVIQSIIFYLLCVYFVFKITELIYKDGKQALFASILYAFAIPALKYSLAFHTTNVGSWFFCIFSIYLTLLYFKKQNEKLIIFNGLISGIGVLMKESGGLGILFFAAMILLSKEFGFKEKVLKIIKFASIFLIPIIFWEVLVSILAPSFQVTSHSKLLSHTITYEIKGGPTESFRVLLYGLSLLTTFGLLGWLLVFWGALKEWKNKNKERIKILLALIPFSFIFLVWPCPDPRHVFIVGTLGALLGSYGLINLKKIFKNKTIGLVLVIIIISLYVIFNYYSYYINDSLPFIDFEDLLHFLKVPN